MNIKKYWLLILIVLVGFLLRFYQLSSIPSSLNWDEVAIGWNAHTIWHTRRDEFGKLLPLTFQSFGDFKAPLLIYGTAPFVGLLGLTELAVRLPSALASLVTIITVFFLAQEIGQKLKLTSQHVNIFSYTSLIFITFSPWQIFFSRGAFEANIALMWITLGVYFFLTSFKKSWLIFLSGLSFILSIYTYHSPKIFLPFFLLFLFIYFRKNLIKNFKNNHIRYIIYFILLIAISFPIIKINLSSQATSRAQGTTILFNNNGQLSVFNLKFFTTLTTNFFTHIKPRFYLSGVTSNYRLGLKNSGIVNLAQFTFFIIGIVFLIKNWRHQYLKLLILWFLLGLLPSILGKDIVPNHIRALNSLVPLVLISSYGLVSLLSKINQKTFKSFVFGFSLLLFSISTINFLKEYFIDFPVYSASDWQYGYKQVVEIAQKYEDEVDRIIITNYYGQPHIFTYFFQNRAPTDVFWGGMVKYRFHPIDWSNDQYSQDLLFVASPEEISPDHPKVIKVINYPDNNPAFVVAKT